MRLLSLVICIEPCVFRALAGDDRLVRRRVDGLQRFEMAQVEMSGVPPWGELMFTDEVLSDGKEWLEAQRRSLMESAIGFEVIQIADVLSLPEDFVW